MSSILVRLLYIIGFLVLAGWVIRWLNRHLTTRPARRPPPPPTGQIQHRGAMVFDPVCRTWVDPSIALTHRHHGQTIHFCSTACRDRFRAQA